MRARRTLCRTWLLAGVMAAAAGLTLPSRGFGAQPPGEQGAAERDADGVGMARLEARLAELERRMAARDDALARIERRLDRMLEQVERDAAEKPAARLRELWEGMRKLRRAPGGGFEFWGGPAVRGLGARLFGNDSRPRLGVYISEVPPEVLEDDGAPDAQGAFVSRVIPGSPADRAGIQAGDIIRRLGGTKIESPAELIREIRERKVRDTVEVVFLRGWKEHKVSVTLEGHKLSLREWGGVLELEEFVDPQVLREWMEQLGEGALGEAHRWITAQSRDAIQVTVEKDNVTATASLDGSALRLSARLTRRLRLTADREREVNEVFSKARQELTAILREAADKAAGKGEKVDFAALDALILEIDTRTEKQIAALLSAVQLEQYRAARRRRTSRALRIERKVNRREGPGPAGPDLVF